MAKILTKDGLKKLQEELEERKVAMRQRIAASIKEAKEQGDLSENAEYSEAKQEQAENESRIAELESSLKDAVVARHNSQTSGVQIGSVVKTLLRGKEMAFTIVGSNEVDPSAGKISHESPLGKAFLNKEKGARISVETPAGSMDYEILDVA
ncbi:MAG: transcription elongation factor GreA [Candidatus Moraniibacteriota bacterium]|nr:MAG: transcription elongation factor GreA [Candidatus Moranbacteria bacterium]